jgi:hypothetical protein
MDEVKTGRKDLVKAEKEYQEEKQKLLALETKLDNKISEKITSLRKELKDKYKVDDTTAPNFGTGTEATDPNRITLREHYLLQTLIQNLRYLVNGDEQKPTGKKNEDEAYTISQQRTREAISKWHQSS